MAKTERTAIRSRRDTKTEATPAKRTSSPLSRARQDRGADTRAQLVEAALDIFGRVGFEGASTRAIAKAAKANLAAIVYHFGGKEALYLAVAEHITDSIMARMGPRLASAAVPAALSTPEAAHAALDQLIDAFVDVILGEAEAERWARFVIREQMQPTAGFDVIYRFMSGAFDTAARLVATATGSALTDDLRITVFALMGQVMVFRMAQTLVLRRMNWRRIGERQRREIKLIVKSNIAAILERRAP